MQSRNPAEPRGGGAHPRGPGSCPRRARAGAAREENTNPGRLPMVCQHPNRDRGEQGCCGRVPLVGFAPKTRGVRTERRATLMSSLLDRGRARATLAVGGAVLVAAFLAGCGFSGDDDSSSESMKRVGLMHVGTDHIPSSWPALKARLAELGWKDGENVELIWRNLEPKQAEGQAQAFVRDGVDVIVAFEDTSIEAAQKATTSRDAVRSSDPIPIVFLHPTDPVRDGLVKTLAYPDTNLTGVYGARDEVDKQLEIYQRLVPGLRRMLTLVDPTDPRTKRLLPGYQAAARQLARPIELDIREASSANDLKRVFRSLRPGEVDGAFLLSPNLRLNHSA